MGIEWVSQEFDRCFTGVLRLAFPLLCTLCTFSNEYNTIAQQFNFKHWKGNGKLTQKKSIGFHEKRYLLAFTPKLSHALENNTNNTVSSLFSTMTMKTCVSWRFVTSPYLQAEPAAWISRLKDSQNTLSLGLSSEKQTFPPILYNIPHHEPCAAIIRIVLCASSFLNKLWNKK